MLIKLIKIRLASLANGQSGDGAKKKRKTGLVYLFICLYIGIVFGGLFFSSFLTIYDAYCNGQGLESLYFAMSVSMGIMLGFVGSVMITQSQLFDAKDNELLLSMPIKPSTILLSRLMTLYLWALFFTGVSMVPALLAFLRGQALSPAGYAVFVLELLTVPLIALTVSIVLAWVLQFFTRFIKNKSVFVIIGTFVFLGLYMYAVNKLDDLSTFISENPAMVEAAYRKRMFPLYACGKAISDPGVSILPMLLVTVVPFAIVFFILSKKFVDLITTKRGFARTEYKAGKLRSSSVRKALVVKELSHFGRTATWVVNGAFACLLQVGVAIAISLKWDSLVAHANNIFGPFLGERALVCICIALVAFSSSMTEITISSISMEGKVLWILKSSPIETIDILKAKLYAHLIVATPFALVSGILLNIFVPMNIVQRVVAVALPVAFCVFNAYFGLAVNLALPKLDWINEAYAIKQSPASTIGALGGMGFLVMIMLAVVWLGNLLPYEIILAALTVILVIGSLAYEKYLHGKGSRRFEQL
ncbi:MAG: hypothetical protein K6E19_07030 [Lachnospiraceae bacterium]|nr:hypothetical protein [Lachnospiraceae bacterium]